jgi:GT2 family glycosyltransferase
MARLSLIIPTKDRPQEILRCLDSVYEHSPEIAEVVVVDQSSAPYQLAARPGLVHLYRPDLSGLTAARNAGVTAASGDIVLFIDDDCLFRSDVAAQTLAEFAAHPDIVGVQAVIVDKDYLPPPISSRVFEHGFFDVNRFGDPSDLRRMAGGGFAFPKSLFERERFDEDGLQGYCYGEDYDFSLRARRWGRLVLAEKTRVEHCPSPNNRFDRKRAFRTRWKNLNYIYAKLRSQTGPADRFWHLWWALGETLQWLRFGYGLPHG